MKKKRILKENTIKKDKKNELGGWLVAVLMGFILAIIQMLYMLAKRIQILIEEGIIGNPGIVVSVILITIYLTSLVISTIFISKKRRLGKKAGIAAMIAMMIFSLWYNLIGIVIFYPPENKILHLINGIVSLVINFSLATIVILYFLKSKRVRETLR